MGRELDEAGADLPDREAIAARILEARRGRNLTLAAVARQMHVTTACVWNWEKGKTLPRPQSLRKLAQVLGTSVERLIGEEPARCADAWAGLPGDLGDARHVVDRARALVADSLGVELDAVRIFVDLGSREDAMFEVRH